jgi:hypothetical protein
MILPGSYANGFAPRDGEPLYPALWRGCVGAWDPGLGPSGLVLRDWSGFKRHGTLTNGPAWVISDENAIRYDGVNDHIALPSVPIVFPLTIVMRVKFLRLINFQGLGATSIGAAGFQLYSTVDGTIYFWCDSQTTTAPAGSVVLNKWHTLAFVMSNGNRQIWVDGTQRNADTKTAPSASYVWNTVYDVQSFYHSNVDGGEFRLYNRVLQPKEIRLLSLRRGIAYELTPRRRSSVQVVGGFRAAWIPRQRLIVGGGL